MSSYFSQMSIEKVGVEKRTHVILYATFFLSGLFIVLNLPIIGDGVRDFRVMDFFGFASIFYLIFTIARKRYQASLLILFLLCGMGLLSVFLDALYDSDSSRLNIIVRFVLSIATGVVVAMLAAQHAKIKTLVVGMWFGAFITCLIAYGQSVNIAYFLEMAPVDRSESAIQGVLRPSAIWGHPNAAAQVTMAGAAMIFIAWDKRGTILLPILMYAVIFILNYTIMQNRAPLVVGTLVCFFATLRQPEIYMRILALMCVGCLAAIFIFDPQSIIGERWTGTFSGLSTFDQAVERVRSTFAGLAISMEAPLGHSLAEREARMIAETGIRASHNGFVFAALVIGPWVTLIFLWLVVYSFALAFASAKGRYYRSAIGSIATMLMFEDAILEPTIVISLSMLVLLISLDEKKQKAHATGGGYF